jgi:hypothetical protein
MWHRVGGFLVTATRVPMRVDALDWSALTIEVRARMNE